jgi:hypothetical protein
VSSGGTKVVLDEDGIRGLLKAGGWPCDRIAPDTWRSHFRGKRASFPFFVRVDRKRSLLVFAIVPLLKSPEDKAQAEKLYRRLLELNHAALMAKFSIDDDLDVVLSVEYPTHELDESEFIDALDVLGYYADRHYDELRALAAGS